MNGKKYTDLISAFNSGNYDFVRGALADAPVTSNSLLGYMNAFCLAESGDLISSLLEIQRWSGQDSSVSSQLESLRFSVLSNYPIPDSLLQELLPGFSVLRVGGAARWLDPFLDFHGIFCIDIDSERERFGTETGAALLLDFHNIDSWQGERPNLIVSSHVIEHLENPIKALKAAIKCLLPGGWIYSVLPYYKETFDHKRAPTSLSHLIDDYKMDCSGPDWVHIEEFLRNYDCAKDLVFRGDFNKFIEVYRDKPERHTHYHVFDLPLVFSMHGYAGFECVSIKTIGNSIHYVGKVL